MSVWAEVITDSPQTFPEEVLEYKTILFGTVVFRCELSNMSRLTEAAAGFETDPVTAEFPIKTSLRSTCKLARIVVGTGPITTFPDANKFVVVTAFDTYTFPGSTVEPSGLKYHL
jgi:hypothetical protein